METELKPCPFCGYTNILIESKSGKKHCNDKLQYVVTVSCRCRCARCNARGSTVHYTAIYPPRLTSPQGENAAEEAKKLWNRRYKDGIL